MSVWRDVVVVSVVVVDVVVVSVVVVDDDDDGDDDSDDVIALMVVNVKKDNNDHMVLVYWTLKNKLQWNFDRNYNIFIKKNAFESVVCKMATILPRLQCANELNVVGNYQFRWTS